MLIFFFFSSRRRHTRCSRDWSSDVCSSDLCEGLTEAVKDGELWKLWYAFIPRAEDMGKEIDRRLGLQAAGSMLLWTVFDADGRIAGMTTYMNVDAPNRRVEIG